MTNNLNNRDKIYLASDFHLGVPDEKSSLLREKQIVSWLSAIEHDAKEIYLVGDIFDFWFEYKRAIPKGFVRLQGKIASLTDKGIPVHVFTGNHDMWIFDYLPKELGIQLHKGNITRVFFEKKYLIGHGDGLGPGDRSYKFLKLIFQNSICKWLFARLHPNFGIWIAQLSSRSSRNVNPEEDKLFSGIENEYLYVFCKQVLEKEHFDFFIFGHRHLPLKINLNKQSQYINLGEWISYNTFVQIDSESTKIKQFKENKIIDFHSSLTS